MTISGYFAKQFNCKSNTNAVPEFVIVYISLLLRKNRVKPSVPIIFGHHVGQTIVLYDRSIYNNEDMQYDSH